jgi:DNA-binding beta-propeller fold protein YncE
MRSSVGIFAVILLLSVPAGVSADSRAYIVAPGGANTPGSMAPFDTAKGTLGAEFFVPRGNMIAVAPGTKQVWQTVGAEYGPWDINILNPESGATLATIPLASYVASLIFDAAGKYAYASLGNGSVIKIDVASRTVDFTSSLGAGVNVSQLVLSSDGAKLFVDAFYPKFEGILVLDSQTLTIVADIPFPYPHTVLSMFVSGNTLLVTDDGESLSYFDTSSLQQTNSAAVPEVSVVFGVSPDASKIYLATNCYCADSSGMEVMDFSSGQILLTQSFSDATLTGNVFLSPDGSQIAVAEGPILLIDPETLATIKTVWSAGVTSAAYLDADTLLIFNGDVAAMMVVDQSSAQVMDTFPLGPAGPSGEVADPTHDFIYTGGSDNPNVVSAKINRIVENLAGYGSFVPTAIAGNQLYGLDYGGSQVYNLMTAVYDFLPQPVTPPRGDVVVAYSGAAPPNAQTYWVPFVLGTDNEMVIERGIAIYSTATNAVAGRILLPAGYYGPAVFSPDSRTLYIVGPMTIAVYSATTFQQTGSFPYATTFTSLAASPDGSVLYATDDKSIYVLDAVTGALTQTFALPSPVQGAMALSPDGTTLFLTDSTTNTVDLIDTASGQVTVVLLPYTPSTVVVLP